MKAGAGLQQCISKLACMKVMRVNWKTVTIILSGVYIAVTLATMYRLYSDVIARFKSDGKFKCRKQICLFCNPFPQAAAIYTVLRHAIIISTEQLHSFLISKA